MKLSSANINVMVRACRKAAKILIRDFGEIEKLQVSLKGPGDFVTISDKKVEKILIEELQKARPNYSILSEEIGKITNDEEFKWIIDPIDGTTNFIHGIPIFGIVVAKLYNDEITDGVIFNPVTNDFYWASKGKGAWCNNARLRVSKRNMLNECIVGTGIPHAKKTYNNYLNEINKISINSSGLRRLGSAAIDLAYVAAGKLDAFWERNLAIWDVSSGVLLVKEAGGKITEPNGNPWNISSKDILASNSKLHEIIQEKIG